MTELRLKPRPHAVPARSIVHVIQGEFRITSHPDAMLTTTLGSCVAACLRDPEAKVGGMNHFLLPRGQGSTVADSRRFGAHAMEVLINALLQVGARRERLEAKLFGGARLSENLPDVGALNVEFARQYLVHEGIALRRGCLGGKLARRIQFWPVSGRVRQLGLATLDAELIGIESRAPTIETDGGDVEFFDALK